jgi:hypothetical protein
VFERLAAMVEELPVPSSPAEVAELAAIVERASVKFELGVAAVERTGEWGVDGDVSLTAWLRRACRLPVRDAALESRVASRLNRLPVLAEAFESGSMSRAQVACVVANLTDRSVGLFAEHEADLLPTFAMLEPGDLAIAMRRWAAIAEDLLGRSDPAPRRQLRLSRTLDGRRELSGSFDAEGGAILEAALATTSTWDADDQRSASERLGDALVEVARQHLATFDQPSPNRNRPRIELVLSVDDLEHARLRDGTTLDAATTGRILCDSTIVRVVTGGPGVILDYGRETRVVPVGLRNAVVARDRHCRGDGCDRPPSWSEVHHVVPWEHGGSTSIDNLVLLCIRHHHLLHQPGWHAKLRPDGTLEITSPTGRHVETRPPPW